ncbi:TonB-dependent receptor [uncultured Caulobacter sp.]|uniref:TonB-dependent receptor n=1 Tax=uncultured Caulobacter sp. TaxID=158749 RepID=UPI00262BF38C|nr:TonB-dependent receptor [uncultured Caulobacter sp.]
MLSRNLVLASASISVLAGAARAQTTKPATPAPVTTPAKAATPKPSPAKPVTPEDLDTEVEAVTITASGKPYGAVLGDIPPEETFNAADVRSFGVSSMEDLLTELQPQTTSGLGGDPVVLLNGRRISGQGEIRDIPTEAIQRVEILPEEVALKYGYTADQKVVNIVLRQRFRASTIDAGVGGSTAGGQTSEQLNWSRLQLNREGRTNLAVKIQHSDRLLESDRDLVSTGQSGLYDLVGNIGPGLPGASQIDPAFSALAGQPVTVAGVPASAATGRPGLAAFLPTANRANTSDLSDSRTLLPENTQLSINTVTNRYILDNVSATLNLGLTASRNNALLGPARARLTIPGGDPFSPFSQNVALYRYLGELNPLEQTTNNVAGHLGFTLNRDTEALRLSLTGNYDHAISKTLTDRSVDLTSAQARLNALDPTFNPFAPLTGAPNVMTDNARSISDTGDLQLVVNGALMKLRAGDLSTTLKVGVNGTKLDARSFRAGLESNSDLSRRDANAQVSFDLPLTSRRKGVRAGLGDFSVNVNLAAHQLSDFGTLTRVGGGLNWSPVKPLTLVASMNHQENAPSLSQLGGPLVTTPDSRVFDYVTGQTVDVTRISGGNPNLLAEKRNVLRLGGTFKPDQVQGLSVVANYTRVRIDNPVASFPAATAAVEAAFPDRFQRDATGALTRIDTRPVNFARRETDQVRWGFNFSRQIGKTPPPPPGGFGGFRARQDGQAVPGADLLNRAPSGDSDANRPAAPATTDPNQASQAPAPQVGDDTPRPSFDGGGRSDGDGRRYGGGGGGGRGFGGGGFGGRGGGNPRATRLQLALFHTIHLREQVTIADSLPTLDLLHGDVLGSGGGQARHEIEAQAGLTHYGLGARLSANWQSATHVRGGTLGGASSDLDFSDLATINLRLFADLGVRRELVQAHPILRGTRLSLSVNNLFDARQTVRDANGVTPVTYQPDYLDPKGRVVQLSIRKLLF